MLGNHVYSDKALKNIRQTSASQCIPWLSVGRLMSESELASRLAWTLATVVARVWTEGVGSKDNCKTAWCFPQFGVTDFFWCTQNNVGLRRQRMHVAAFVISSSTWSWFAAHFTLEWEWYQEASPCISRGGNSLCKREMIRAYFSAILRLSVTRRPCYKWKTTSLSVIIPIPFILSPCLIFPGFK